MEDYIQYIRSFVGKNKVIMVAAGIFILDGEDRVLLQLRSDNKEWAHPGGFMELGEKIADTARREALEETGLTLGHMDFLGIYSGVENERAFKNGDEVAVFKVMFICRDYTGELHKDNNESLALQFFPLDALPDIWKKQKLEFADLLSGQRGPVIN